MSWDATWQRWLTAAVMFAFLAVVFVPLERAFTRRRQGILRPAWRTDLAFVAGQFLVWNGLAIAWLGLVAQGLYEIVPATLRESVARQPLGWQVLEVVLLCDLTVYWGHRLSHRVGFLWRFHRVHHTAEHLDWLAAYREHPLDGLYTMTLENLGALALGFPLELIAGFVFFRGIWAVFIHSNVRVPLGPFKVLIGSPELHHWHHDAGRGGDCNFANLSPLMDVLFGTYYAPPGRDPERLGIDEPTPRSYLGQLAYPMVPQSFRPLWGRRSGGPGAVAKEVSTPPIGALFTPPDALPPCPASTPPRAAEVPPCPGPEAVGGRSRDSLSTARAGARGGSSQVTEMM